MTQREKEDVLLLAMGIADMSPNKRKIIIEVIKDLALEEDAIKRVSYRSINDAITSIQNLSESEKK